MLAEGRIVAVGAPAQVFTPELIRTTFGVDVRILGDIHEPVFAFHRLETVAAVLEAASSDSLKESSLHA